MKGIPPSGKLRVVRNESNHNNNPLPRKEINQIHMAKNVNKTPHSHPSAHFLIRLPTTLKK